MTVLRLYQEFLDSGDDTLPSDYLNSKVLTEEESNKIEGEITLYSWRWKDQALQVSKYLLLIGCESSGQVWNWSRSMPSTNATEMEDSPPTLR